MLKILLFSSSIFVCIAVTSAHQDVIVEPVRCPGLYCGWRHDEDGNRTSCGACPRGAAPNEDKDCEMCTGSPTMYDFLYLGFMALLAPVLHIFFIDSTNRKKCNLLIVLHASALIECIVAAICTVLVSKPIGTFKITSCPVNRLSDWYTMLKNPSPDYTSTLHCTQEAVFPLYTIVMIYYAFCLACMLFVRIALSIHVAKNKGKKSIYAALYFLPILMVVHSIFAGLVYYAFPYILLVASVVTNAIHFTYFDNQNIKYLLKENFMTLRNLAILVGHWLLHAYGIIALTQLTDPGFHGYFLLLIPFPAMFYLLTVRFTDPAMLLNV